MQPANTGVGHVISSNTGIMSRVIAPWTEEHATATIAAGGTVRRFRPAADAGTGKNGAH